MGLLSDAAKLVSPLTSPAQALYAQISTSRTRSNALDIDHEIRLLEAGASTGASNDDENALHDSGYLVGADEKGLQHQSGKTTTYGQEVKVLLGYVLPLFVSQIAMRYSSTMGESS